MNLNKALLYTCYTLLLLQQSTIVHAATQSNFDIKKEAELDMFLTQNKPTIVAFYSPSCPHCQHYIPQFEKQASQFPRATFLAVNLAKFPSLKNKYGIMGIPTTVYFLAGKEHGQRTIGNNTADLRKHAQQLTTDHKAAQK